MEKDVLVDIAKYALIKATNHIQKRVGDVLDDLEAKANNTTNPWDNMLVHALRTIFFGDKKE